MLRLKSGGSSISLSVVSALGSWADDATNMSVGLPNSNRNTLFLLAIPGGGGTPVRFQSVSCRKREICSESHRRNDVGFGRICVGGLAAPL
jgi:hypothetical protein